jgi:hypothetical protein
MALDPTYLLMLAAGVCVEWIAPPFGLLPGAALIFVAAQHLLGLV